MTLIDWLVTAVAVAVLSALLVVAAWISIQLVVAFKAVA